jgi:hypothetical protein
MTVVPMLADEQLLNKALETLKNEGRIEYSGEYGAELTTFIPFVAWLKSKNLLHGGKVVSYSGMKPYYFFLDDEEFLPKEESRSWVPPTKRMWPNNRTDTARASTWNVYPDYRGHYVKLGRTFDRPVLFLQNKFAVEWEMGPINYFPLNVLRFCLRIAIKRFHVIYSRPGSKLERTGYSADHNKSCDYPDLHVVRSFPNVEIFEETCLRDGLDYNETKLQLLAKSHHFVSVQGGGAHLLSCFNNSILLVLHRRGLEYPNAYRTGPYKYLSSPPPLLLVARKAKQLAEGMNVVLSADAGPHGVRIHPSLNPTVQALRH